MNTWVADDGSWGMGEIVKINLTEADDIAFFADLPENEQFQVAKIMSENSDQSEFDVFSAHAALMGVPDCGDPGPNCVEHNGACD